jgi:hypothetical protein
MLSYLRNLLYPDTVLARQVPAGLPDPSPRPADKPAGPPVAHPVTADPAQHNKIEPGPVPILPENRPCGFGSWP